MKTSEFKECKKSIAALETRDLWALLRSRNAMTERWCVELTYIKAELNKRGHVVT